MGEPITIKRKKKLTIKSKANPEAPAAAEAEAPALVLPGLTPPAPGVANDASAGAPSYTVYAIFAILATLMFIGIIAIQYFELTYLLPAFPRPIPTGM
jgi:hypothetical protein